MDEETLAVLRHVVAKTDSELPRLEQGMERADFEALRVRLDLGGHQAVVRCEEEELPSVFGPPRLAAPVLGDLPVTARIGEPGDVNVEAPALVGHVRDVLSVGR